MKKKILSLCVVGLLAATAIVGGTLAYFTDKAQETNTFTVGSVDIHIDEWQMDESGKWDKYEDMQELAPIAQAKAPFNKMVETVNDGANDAYIRTFITCPSDLYNQLGYGFNSGSSAKDITGDDGKIIHHLDSWADLGKATVGGKEVNIFVCEHKEAIPAGDSILSLTKVWVYENVDNADIGDNFEVNVYSEAIQADNLTYDEAMASLNGNDTVLNHATSLFNK